VTADGIECLGYHGYLVYHGYLGREDRPWWRHRPARHPAHIITIDPVQLQVTGTVSQWTSVQFWQTPHKCCVMREACDLLISP
jgi:hypothetical protein